MVMEIIAGDRRICVSGLAPWKRFILLLMASGGAYSLTTMPSVDPQYIGGVWALVGVGWTFYFVTHKDKPIEEIDREDPDGAAKEKAAPEKSKTQWEQEIAFGSGEYLNKRPKL